MNKKNFLFASLILIGFLFLVTPAFAAEGNAFLGVLGIPEGRLIPTACTDSVASKTGVNDCGLNEILQTVVNFTQLLLGLTGSLALLAFLYGGVLWIISAGKAEMVEKGKQAIIAAVVGLIIMLTSWLIVNTTIAALTQGKVGTTAQIFNQNWFQTPKIDSPGSGAPAAGSEQPAQNPGQNPALPTAPAVPAQPTPQTNGSEKLECNYNYTGGAVNYNQALSLCQNKCAEPCPGCSCSVMLIGNQNESGEATSENFTCYCFKYL